MQRLYIGFAVKRHIRPRPIIITWPLNWTEFKGGLHHRRIWKNSTGSRWIFPICATITTVRGNARLKKIKMPWKAKIILICGILRAQRHTLHEGETKCEYQSAQIQVMNFQNTFQIARGTTRTMMAIARQRNGRNAYPHLNYLKSSQQRELSLEQNYWPLPISRNWRESRT